MRIGILLFLSFSGPSLQAEPNRDLIVAAMRRAAEFFVANASVEGGYVYYLTLEGRRLGEGEAAATEVWVQPPGTPAVGEAFLDAFDATGEAFYLEAARKAGHALAYGQLESGGWRNSIDFDSAGPRVDRYRNGKGRNSGAGNNFSTLDDDISQAALRFLSRLDLATEMEDPTVHDAVNFAISRLLEAQYPNGAFPQGWTGPSANRPGGIKASFPDYDWRSEGRIKEYWNEYTLNDGIALTVTDTLLHLWNDRGDDRALESLKRFGDFLLLAQLPDPQPAWAQQYNAEMHPIWARAFEPPAVSGRESEDVLLALIKIAAITGETRYAEPIVPAVTYLERSLLPDGTLARYYELETNKPLYMQRAGKGYEPTHDDSRLPDHYGWKNPSRIESVKDAYRAHLAGRHLDDIFAPPSVDPATVAKILAELDGEGRWITVHEGGKARLVGQPKFAEGERYLSSEVFATNLSLLSRALKP